MHTLALTILQSPIESDADFSSRRACFLSHDGVAIFYRYWPAVQARGRRAVVLLHREYEHSGRMEHLVEELGLPDCSFFAWDARSHGCSPGVRGDSPSIASMAEDLDAFVRLIAERHGIPTKNVAVLGQGAGALLAAAWAHDFAPSIRCLILAAPALKAKLNIPWARWALRRLYSWRGKNFFLNSHIRGKQLTHDPKRVASYEQDLLISRRISVRMLLGFHDAAERVLADARSITLPLQLLVCGADRGVHRATQQQFFERVGSVDKEMHCFDSFYPDILGERDRQLAIGKIRAFLVRQYAQTEDTLRYHQTDREVCATRA